MVDLCSMCVCENMCQCVGVWMLMMHLFTLEVLAKSGDPILTALGTPCNLAILLQIIKTMIGFSKHTKFIYFYTPVTKLGLSWNRVVRFSVCHAFVRKISSEPRNYATKLGMMVQHRDLECHAKSLGSYLQGQGPRLSDFTEKGSPVSRKLVFVP